MVTPVSSSSKEIINVYSMSIMIMPAHNLLHNKRRPSLKPPDAPVGKDPVSINRVINLSSALVVDDTCSSFIETVLSESFFTIVFTYWQFARKNGNRQKKLLLHIYHNMEGISVEIIFWKEDKWIEAGISQPRGIRSGRLSWKYHRRYTYTTTCGRDMYLYNSYKQVTRALKN